MSHLIIQNRYLENYYKKNFQNRAGQSSSNVETLVFRVPAKMRWWVLSQMFDLSTSAECFCVILQKKGKIWEKLCSIKSNSNKQSARATQKYDD